MTRIDLELEVKGRWVRMTIWPADSSQPHGELHSHLNWAGGAAPPADEDLTECRREIWEATLASLPEDEE